jgi:hypothetical protein
MYWISSGTVKLMRRKSISETNGSRPNYRVKDRP